MEKFTKGPWRISEHGAIKSEHAKTATGAVSVSGLSNPMYQCQEAEANAAIIAAAPEMYDDIKSDIEWLKKMRNLFVIGSDMFRSCSLRIESKEKLLAKARGEHDN